MEKQPIVEKPKPITSPSLNEQLSFLLSQQEQSRQKEIWRDEVEIKVQTRGLPFMLMPLADIHAGSSGVDYQALREHLDFIKEYPVYTVLVGDLADNFSPTAIPSGMRGQMIEPDEQYALVRAFFKEYQEKILANVGGGNHDERLVKNSGFDVFRWLAEDLNIPLLKSGGLLRLRVDNQDYKVRLYHRIARLNSQFNLTHAGFQALRLSGDDADVLISADKHIGGLSVQNIGDKKRTVIQLGTFKVEDDYGRSQGFVQKPKPFYPVLLFFQGQHNIEAIENLHQAKEMIEMMVKYYQQLAVSVLGYGKGTKS